MTPDKMASTDKMASADREAAGPRSALEWGSAPEATSAPTRISSRLAISAPAGLAVLLLAGSVAFGQSSGLFERIPSFSGGTGPGSFEAVDDASPATGYADKTARPRATDKPRPAEPEKAAADDVAKTDELAQAEPTEKPAPEPDPTAKPEQAAPTEKPKPQPHPEPEKTPKPQPQPAPQPPTAALALSVLPDDYPEKVLLGWSAFSGDGFSYYKLVRSRDANATWPASGDDEVIGAFGSPGETWAKDRPACGVTFFYRVFAVRKTDAGYQVLAPSNTVSASTTCAPEPPPPPATAGIGLEGVFAEGQVKLSWGACPVAGFNAWKIVRSQTNAEPMYPENEGTELIAAIGEQSQTFFSDASVASGQTWFYRVLARADQGGGNFIACQSAAVAVTIP